MGKLLKWLFYLIILGFVALLVYAYLGPIFDADFAPTSEEIRIPVELDAN
ncbi:MULTISPECIES: hypothetical protein [Lentibacter]|jgi:hypothetical protein|uniref:Uncharacterized protein n=1 Tax=Lentibacter algarum TaxID=576131 RepID=A0A1H3KNG7_9RHOB|nr:hypothetical protein [Lentibacter algarum]MCO4777372.1 hypothetical protein [Lentibacter algarum]MCO4826893.1 hypothetical protein [Lentibacter algarum]WIF31835.1 hypothetical protein LentiSH36_01368 [Lentibacter algarum]SDY53692.1 hypothetical protein SAMN05444486_102655 [Lentibacter algarum]